MGVIFKFNREANIKDWNIVDDAVMGGKSIGKFDLNPDGFGSFSGEISLENNGGFSSIQYKFQPLKVSHTNTISVKLKGDGNSYQLRIKDHLSTNHSYITVFETSGTWQEIQIPLKDMYAHFRGIKLDLPNFSADYIEQISFLIANKKPGKFELVIDKIEVR